MEFISHRVNTLSELEQVKPSDGIEVDLRPWGNDIILAHDPFVEGESFESLLQKFGHGTLILNVKSERIEPRIIELLKKYKLQNYFFLDCSIPMINFLINQYGEKNIAVRLSELEPLEALRPFQGLVKWVWVDCFTSLILNKSIEETLHTMGFKICLVSPELQGRNDQIEEYRNYIFKNQIILDAVCSKNFNRHRWV